VRRSAGSAALSAILLFAARETCAQQVGTLTNTRGLDFGKFVARTGGTVVMSPAGVRSSTGAVILLNSPSANSASFTVGASGGGKPLKTVSFSLPSDTAVRLTSGSNSMALTTFVSSPAAGVNNNLASVRTVTVGATLQVGANQAPGNYSGSFSLIANFQ
jgi:hypothetical protein